MKKRAIILAGMMMLSMMLTACQAADKGNRFEMPSEDLATLGQTQATEAPGETKQTEDPQEESRSASGQLSVPYQYANMQKDIPSGNFMDDGDKVVFGHQYQSRFLLFAVDKETLEVRLLCQDASCGHNGPECISYNKTGNLEQYDGTLYAMDGGISGEIVTIQGDKTTKTVDGTVSGFWHANGNLYVLTPDQALLCYEEGSKKPKTILEDYTGHWSVVNGTNLYATTWDNNTIRVDLSAESPEPETLAEQVWTIFDMDRQTAYYVDMEDGYRLYRCGLDFQDPERLTEEGVLFTSINFDENYVYLRLLRDGDYYGDGCDQLYRMRLDAPGEPEPFIEIPESIIRCVYTVPNYGYLFVETERETGKNGDETEYCTEYYAVSKDGKESVKLEIPEI